MTNKSLTFNIGKYHIVAVWAEEESNEPDATFLELTRKAITRQFLEGRTCGLVTANRETEIGWTARFRRDKCDEEDESVIISEIMTEDARGILKSLNIYDIFMEAYGTQIDDTLEANEWHKVLGKRGPYDKED